MSFYIGLDLGISAAKILLVDGQGEILKTVTKEYPLEFSKPGWSQQNPEDWKRAVFEGIPELLTGFDASEVAGIGCGGQMHGLVVLDENDDVIRPAILWNDGRKSFSPQCKTSCITQLQSIPQRRSSMTGLTARN